MTDNIKLTKLPEPDICRYVVTVWRDGVECEIDKGPRYTVEQMQAYAREAVRLNATVPVTRDDSTLRSAFEQGYRLQYFVVHGYDSEWTDYKSCDCPTTQGGRLVWRVKATAPAAPQPLTDEKDALLRQALEALEGFIHITNDSQGVAGYHLSGDTAEWDEFDEVDAASNTIEAIREHLGVKND